MAKKHAAKTSDDGVLYCTLIEGRNLAAMDGGVSSDPYCQVKASFNKQAFKTKVVKKTLNPKWDQQFSFYVSAPTGNILIKVWDKDTLFDDKLGELTIPVEQLKNGEALDQWFTLEGEPKKKKGAHSSHKGEIHVKLHFPSAKKEAKEVHAAPAKGSAEAAKPAGQEKTQTKAIC